MIESAAYEGNPGVTGYTVGIWNTRVFFTQVEMFLQGMFVVKSLEGFSRVET